MNTAEPISLEQVRQRLAQVQPAELTQKRQMSIGSDELAARIERCDAMMQENLAAVQHKYLDALEHFGDWLTEAQAGRISQDAALQALRDVTR